MPVTARQLIDSALAMIGATPQGMAPTDIQYSEALKFLKAMVYGYEARGYNIANKIRDTIPLVSGQSIYTIGTAHTVSRSDMFLLRDSATVATFPFIPNITGAKTLIDSAGTTYAEGATTFSYAATGLCTMIAAGSGGTLTANTPYTMQASLDAPDVDTGRPAPEKILSASTDMSGVEYPVDIVSDVDFDNIPVKSASSNVDTIYYQYNPSSYAYSSITVYPVPSGSGNLYIRYLDVNSNLDGATVYDWKFPDDSEEFLASNLAIRLAPTYDKEAPGTVASIADVANRAMQAKKKPMNRPIFDGAMRHSRTRRLNY